MKSIRETLARRTLKPTDAMVVCGGFHLFLDRDDETRPPESPSGTVYTTVVPYSFFQVSELSGYGAGNRAPQFYQTGWDLFRAGRSDDLLAEHVVAVLKRARREGQSASSADSLHAAATCVHLRRAIDMDLPNLIAEVQTACGAAVDADSQFVSLCAALSHLTVIDRYAVYRNLRRAELTDLIARGFDRSCFALPDVASAPEEQHAAIISALKSLAELVLRGDRDDVDRAVFANHVRTSASLSTIPFLRGAFLGLLAELREISPDELAGHVSAFAKTSPDQMVVAGDFLAGVLTGSRTSVMLGAESLVAAIDELLRAAEWDVFLTMLPCVRAAFEQLHDRQRDSLAACVARKYGLSEEARDRLTELKTSVGAAALIANIDRRVAEIMRKWSFS